MSKNKKRIPTDSKGLIHFLVTSGWGGNTNKPYVKIEVGDYSTQVSPEGARAVALNLLQAAEAAESDGHFIRFCQQMQFDQETTIQALRAFRTMRDERHGKTAESA